MDADGCYCFNNFSINTNEYAKYKAYLQRLILRRDVFLCFLALRT